MTTLSATLMRRRCSIVTMATSWARDDRQHLNREALATTARSTRHEALLRGFHFDELRHHGATVALDAGRVAARFWSGGRTSIDGWPAFAERPLD